MMQLVASDRVDDEAREWVYRITAGEPSEECEAWRALDPSHEAAFRDAWITWNRDALAATSTAQRDDWRAELAALKVRPWHKKPLIRVAMPTALAASIAAALMFTPLAKNRIRTPHPAVMQIATKIAEDKVVALGDGSTLTVGADSKIAVNLAAPNRREVVLEEGQAFFDVAADPDRPFIVFAGDAEIRVLGTKFDVHRIGDQVQVSVLQGRVEVRRRGQGATNAAAGSDRILTAGEQSILQPQLAAGFTPERPVAVTPGEWRAGRLYYVDAPLSDIVADANRYNKAPIRLSGAVGKLRMTTSFRTGDAEGLAANIEATLGLKARRAGDGSVALGAR